MVPGCSQATSGYALSQTSVPVSNTCTCLKTQNSRPAVGTLELSVAKKSENFPGEHALYKQQGLTAPLPYRLRN